MENTPAPLSDTANLPKNGHTHPAILSSNFTLFWRVFVPIFGTVFLTVLVLACLLTDENSVYVPLLPPIWAKVLIGLLWLGWLLLVRRTVWRLHRVDADDTHLFITNYWTTVRYPWEAVTQLEEKRRAGRRIVQIHLRIAGRFGDKIAFLPGTYYDEWIRAHGKMESFSVN